MIRSILQSIQGSGSRAAAAFAEAPSSPWLISYPRTGSHWLRMILERATDRPVLPRSFFEHDHERYLLVHSHDFEFKQEPGKLIYLYRDPVPTVFSQIKFHGQDPRESYFATLWSDLYRLRLRHWLTRPHEDRTLVRYESLAADGVREVGAVLAAVGEDVEAERLSQVMREIDHHMVIQKTKHDPRVMNAEHDYEAQRSQFIERFGAMVRARVVEHGGLERWFGHLEPLSQEAA